MEINKNVFEEANSNCLKTLFAHFGCYCYWCCSMREKTSVKVSIINLIVVKSLNEATSILCIVLILTKQKRKTVCKLCLITIKFELVNWF